MVLLITPLLLVLIALAFSSAWCCHIFKRVPQQNWPQKIVMGDFHSFWFFFVQSTIVTESLKKLMCNTVEARILLFRHFMEPFWIRLNSNFGSCLTKPEPWRLLWCHMMVDAENEDYEDTIDKWKKPTWLVRVIQGIRGLYYPVILGL